MSFGYSVGDFVLLAQLAHRTIRNCQKAGGEYVEIAQEVRSLHSVLRTLRSEAQRPGSGIFSQDGNVTRELIEAVGGCKNVLDELSLMLSKYEGLGPGGSAGRRKRLWQRFVFGSKIEDLAAFRGKLITYTSMISVLLDTMQIKAAGRIERKIDDGFTEVIGNFESMRKEIFTIAVHERARQRVGSTVSMLSLSTYAGDDRVVWREFRRELIRKGFHSSSLEKHRDVLQAYMLRLHESGVLDERLEESSDEEQEREELVNSPHDSDLTRLRQHVIRPLLEEQEGETTNEPDQSVTDSDASSIQQCIGKPLWDGEEELYAVANKWRARQIFARDCFQTGEPLSFESWRSNREKRPRAGVSFVASPLLKFRRGHPVPLRGILRKPTPQFPEELNPKMEGAAPRELSGKNGVRFDERCTKFKKGLIAPELLESRRMRYEVTGNDLLVLQYMSDRTVELLVTSTRVVRTLRSIGIFSTLRTIINMAQESNADFERYHIYAEIKMSDGKSTSQAIEVREREVLNELYRRLKKDNGNKIVASLIADLNRHTEEFNGMVDSKTGFCASTECSCTLLRHFHGKVLKFSERMGQYGSNGPYLVFLQELTEASGLLSDSFIAMFCGRVLGGEETVLEDLHMDLSVLFGFGLLYSLFEE